MVWTALSGSRARVQALTSAEDRKWSWSDQATPPFAAHPSATKPISRRPRLASTSRKPSRSLGDDDQQNYLLKNLIVSLSEPGEMRKTPV
jgi:hypothetical protein